MTERQLPSPAPPVRRNAPSQRRPAPSVRSPALGNQGTPRARRGSARTCVSPPWLLVDNPIPHAPTACRTAGNAPPCPSGNAPALDYCVETRRRDGPRKARVHGPPFSLARTLRARAPPDAPPFSRVHPQDRIPSIPRRQTGRPRAPYPPSLPLPAAESPLPGTRRQEPLQSLPATRADPFL